MTRTFTARDNGPDRPLRRITWRIRALVLGGLALAAVYTGAALALGARAEHVGPLWMVAVAWTVAASLTGALWQGFRHHDWSAFSAYQLPEGDRDMDEWTRTDPYSWPGDIEFRLLHDHDHLR